MTDSEIEDIEFERFLEGKSELNAAYRVVSVTTAPAELQTSIRARAERAVMVRPRVRAWMVDRPVAWAAVIVVCAGLLVLMSPERFPDSIPSELDETADLSGGQDFPQPPADAFSASSLQERDDMRALRKSAELSETAATLGAGPVPTSPQLETPGPSSPSQRHLPSPDAQPARRAATAASSLPADRVSDASAEAQSEVKLESQETVGKSGITFQNDRLGEVRRLMLDGQADAAASALVELRADFPQLSDDDLTDALGPDWRSLASPE